MTGFFSKGSKNKDKKYLQSKKSELKKSVKEKKYAKALKIGSEILKKNPDDLDVLFILGGLNYMNGKFSQAISYLDKVLDTSSYDPEALLLKANSHFKLGQYKESISSCEKIIEVDPKNKGAIELLEKIQKNNL